MNRLYFFKIIPSFLFIMSLSSIGHARNYTPQEIQILKTGTQPSQNWSRLDKIIAYLKELPAEPYRNDQGDRNPLCQQFFHNTQALHDQALTLFEASAHLQENFIDREYDAYLYSQARIEMLISWLNNQLSLVQQNLEGGKSLMGLTKTICPIPDRPLWVKNMERRIFLISQAYPILWPTRGLRNNYALSIWLEQKMIEQAEAKKKHFVLSTTAALVLYPVAFRLLAARLRGLFSSKGLSPSLAEPTLTMGLISSYGAASYLQREPLTLGEVQSLQHELSHFLKTPLNRPEIYRDTVVANEQANGAFLKKELQITDSN